MSEHIGRITIGAILAVAVVVGLAFELNYFVPGNTSATGPAIIGGLTTSSALNSTSWFGDEAPPASCGQMTLATGGLNEGYREDVYVSLSSMSSGPPGAVLGSTVCIYTYLQNLDNKSTSLPSGENVTVTNVDSTNTSRLSGIVFFQSGCAVATSYSGSFGPNSTGWNCNMVWDTSRAYNGILPTLAWPDVYVAEVTFGMSNSSTVIKAPASFSFTAGSTATTTTSSVAGNYCGSPAFKVLTPLQNGSVFLKVVTDQGSIINNGSLLVTHAAPPTAAAPNGATAAYCLRLGANATGYLALAAKDGLPPTGSYNLTLFAGYNQGPGYQATIPPFTVQPNTTVYVTVSVPSGEVYVVTSTQGSSVTTTTTTATSVTNGG